MINLSFPFSSGIGEDDGTHNVEPVDLHAGAHLLTHFQVFLFEPQRKVCEPLLPQEGWRRLHEGAEQTARQAERGDKEVSALYTQYDTQWKQVTNPLFLCPSPHFQHGRCLS